MSHHLENICISEVVGIYLFSFYVLKEREYLTVHWFYGSCTSNGISKLHLFNIPERITAEKFENKQHGIIKNC